MNQLAVLHTFGRPSQIALPPGLTVAQMVAAALPDPIMAARAVVTIQGEVIPADWWGRVRPLPGANVVISARLSGGGGDGGKNPVATVLSIAVMAAAALAAPYVAGALAQAVGAGTTFSAPLGLLQSGFVASASFMSVATPIIGGALSVAGMLAVSALVPTGSQSMSSLSGVGGSAGESATLSISGGGNRANPYGVYPRVYGRHRITPLYCAEPFTVDEGDTQFLYCLFDCGYGPLELTDLQLGDVPLAEFEGVELAIHQRWQAGDGLQIYRNDVTTSSLNIALTAEGGPQVVVSALDADEIRVDIGFQGLTWYTDEGDRAQRSVTIGAAYRPAVGDGEWQPILNWDAGEESTAVDLIEMAAGAWDQVYRTTDPTTGTLTVGVQIPSNLRGSAQIHTVTYALETRLEGATNWTRQVEAKAVVNAVFNRTSTAVYEASHSLALLRGQRAEVRYVLLRQTVWNTDGNTTLIPANGDGVGALPSPVITYTAVGSEFEFTGATAQLARRAITWRPPERGQWQVRLTRITPDSESNRVLDTATITGVVTTTFEPPIAFAEPHTIIEMRIQATDQLSGSISNFRCVATSVLPVWDGAEWTEQATRNPAWIYADVLRGSAARKRRADSRLDLDGLLEWAALCDAPAPQTTVSGAVVGDVDTPTWCCDLVVDYETTLGALLTDIAACGRAARGAPEGRFGVVVDQAQAVAVQTITPRDSWGFRGRRAFSEEIHCLRVRYISPEDDWEQMEVPVYADGYDASNATNFDTLDARGCTRAAQAWRLGRYHLAVMRHRPETYEVQMDVQNLICQRGDLVELAHDAALVGGIATRVTGVTTVGGLVTTITVDELIGQGGGVPMVMRARSATGVLSWHPLLSPVVDAESSVIALATPTAPSQAPAVGDLVVIGEAGQEVIRCLVKEIVPGQDLTARLILVDEAPAVYTADQGVIPPYDAQITRRRGVTPGAVQGLVGSVRTTVRQGAYYPSVVLAWDPVSGATFEVYRRVAGAWKLLTVTRSQSYEITGLTRGDTVDVCVVAVGSSGAKLPLAQASRVAIVVSGVDMRPTAVQDFSAALLGDRLRLTWGITSETVGRWLRLRWSPAITGATWGTAVDVAERVAYPGTSVDVPARVGTYLAKWVDAQGLESATAAQVVTTVPGLTSYNAVREIAAGPQWDGNGASVRVASDGLRLTGAVPVSQWPQFGAVPSMGYGASGLASEGVFTLSEIADLGAVLPVRITAELSVAGADILSRVGAWPSVRDRPLWSGADPSSYDVTLEISTTNDDPSGAASWTDWAPFAVGDVRARAFRLRVRLLSKRREVTPVVYSARLVIDAPDRLQSGDDLLCPAGGTWVAFDAPFYALGAVAITGQGMASGDRYVITGRAANGFNLAFYAADGSAVARTFDYIAKGY